MRSKSKTIRILLIFSITLIFTIGAFLFNSEDTNGVEVLPRVSVILEKPIHEVDVRPNMTGLLEIDGVVRVESPWPEGYSDIKITLSADTGGWKYEVPETIVLTEEMSSKNFTIIIHVPLETSCSTEAEISIAGDWISESKDRIGTVTSDMARIRIKQYYQFSISSEEDVGVVKIGEEQGYLCRLINEGNGNDRIMVEIVNLDNLTENGINVTLSQNKFQVPEKQEKQFTVNINTSNSIVPGNYSILLRAISAQAEGLGDVCDVSDLELILNVDPNDASTEEVPFLQIHLLVTILFTISLFVFIKKRRDERSELK